MTPLDSGVGSNLLCSVLAGISALACDINEAAADARGDGGAIATGGAGAGMLGADVSSSSASATSVLEVSDGLRSLTAATVRRAEAFSRFSARRLRMMASREPALWP